jgi:hypothetical protein
MRLKFVMVLLIAWIAPAQNSSGYLFFAPGASVSTWGSGMTLQAGGGVDVHLAKGIGANVEASALGPKDDLLSTVGLISLGGTYRFRHDGDVRVQPFAAGGYSMMFRSGHANLYYFGAGITWWAARHVGLRAEFRDNVYPSPAVHYVGFRFGIAFR